MPYQTATKRQVCGYRAACDRGARSPGVPPPTAGAYASDWRLRGVRCLCRQVMSTQQGRMMLACHLTAPMGPCIAADAEPKVA
jgi:hypothetical protein